MTEKRNRPEGKAADGGDGMDGIFDDGDEMDMDTTMTTNDDKEGEATSAEVKSVTNKSYFSPQFLAQYYSRLFPFDLLHEWLSYDPSCNQKGEQKSQSPTNTKIFSRREFSFTIEPIPGEEIYIRYQSFLDQAELTNAVLKRNPHKIDIGAIFSHPPKDHHAIQGSTQRKFAPVQRELVFDVDLTDYDGVRKCGCSAANICTKCWKMMGMAMKVMDVGLKEDFGFKNIAWFYSGRRGIHAWICDESARELSDAGRSAVASYFEVRNTMYFTVTTCVDTIYFEKVRAWASYTY
jgi:DNA primase small subunit